MGVKKEVPKERWNAKLKNDWMQQLSSNDRELLIKALPKGTWQVTHELLEPCRRVAHTETIIVLC